MLNLTLGGLSGGYRKYLQRLAPLLSAHRDVEEVLQIVPAAYVSLPGLSAPSSWMPGEQWRGFPRLRHRVREWRPDVVFIPTARYLDVGAPCVSMVRNMEPMLPATFREGVGPWAKSRLGAFLARNACRQSTRIIAVSAFVRDFLVNEWKVEPQKVGVVYHGIDEVTVVPAPSAKLNVRAPFLFAAGSLLAYRGLEDAITALSRTSVPGLTLVIAGEGSATYRERMQQLATSLGVGDRLLWLGHLAEDDMSWAYSNCLAFVMTSRVEACPNTALEAMACGAVCISTRSLPMPEFFRQSALYYDAGDAEQLAAQIGKASSLDADARFALQRTAKSRSMDFSWQRTANATVEQLAHAISQSTLVAERR
ncbi:MAG: glycosyltransferase [Phycisphaerae bacterium]|nr:glycosyltransferase [Gemmatimonadaceae bacterium]